MLGHLVIIGVSIVSCLIAASSGCPDDQYRHRNYQRPGTIPIGPLLDIDTLWSILERSFSVDGSAAESQLSHDLGNIILERSEQSIRESLRIEELTNDFRRFASDLSERVSRRWASSPVTRTAADRPSRQRDLYHWWKDLSIYRSNQSLILNDQCQQWMRQWSIHVIELILGVWSSDNDAPFLFTMECIQNTMYQVESDAMKLIGKLRDEFSETARTIGNSVFEELMSIHEDMSNSADGSQSVLLNQNECEMRSSMAISDFPSTSTHEEVLVSVAPRRKNQRKRANKKAAAKINQSDTVSDTISRPPDPHRDAQPHHSHHQFLSNRSELKSRLDSTSVASHQVLFSLLERPCTILSSDDRLYFAIRFSDLREDLIAASTEVAVDREAANLLRDHLDQIIDVVKSHHLTTLYQWHMALIDVINLFLERCSCMEELQTRLHRLLPGTSDPNPNRAVKVAIFPVMMSFSEQSLAFISMLQVEPVATYLEHGSKLLSSFPEDVRHACLISELATVLNRIWSETASDRGHLLQSLIEQVPVRMLSLLVSVIQSHSVVTESVRERFRNLSNPRPLQDYMSYTVELHWALAATPWRITSRSELGHKARRFLSKVADLCASFQPSPLEPHCVGLSASFSKELAKMASTGTLSTSVKLSVRQMISSLTTSISSSFYSDCYQLSVQVQKALGVYLTKNRRRQDLRLDQMAGIVLFMAETCVGHILRRLTALGPSYAQRFESCSNSIPSQLQQALGVNCTPALYRFAVKIVKDIQRANQFTPLSSQLVAWQRQEILSVLCYVDLVVSVVASSDYEVFLEGRFMTDIDLN